MGKEHILWKMNTLYWERIHFIGKKHIALGRNKNQYKKNKSVLKLVSPIARNNVVLEMNTFYGE